MLDTVTGEVVNRTLLGLIPGERSSGRRQRLGKITKQGSPLLRFLWSEAGVHAVRRDPELKHFYRRKLVQKGLGKARVAVARKLGIRLWIMLRDQIDYEEFCRRGQKQSSSAACRADLLAALKPSRSSDDQHVGECRHRTYAVDGVAATG